METATDSMANDSQLTNGQTELNSNDKAKRKSVSFVDEKLIMDALNSTSTMSNGAKSGSIGDRPSTRSQPRPNRANFDKNGNKPNGRPSDTFSNGTKGPGKRYSNSAPNGHSKGNYYKSAATNGAAKNAVIVYYNDPQAEINVDQLLTKPVSEPAKVDNCAQHAPKSAQPNGHKQNGSRVHNEHKYHDNWRQPKSVKSEHPNKPFNGHGGAKPNGKPSGKPNGYSRTNSKTNDTSEKMTTKSEPITIYYSTVESSEMIEQNLKQLQLKSTDQAQPNGAADKPTPKPLSNGEPAMVPPSEPQATESSQVNVIKTDQMEVDTVPVAVTGDQYDVINGGESIKGPVLPEDGCNNAVLCMLVSHPGHFYVKFINTQHESLMNNMNQFYHSDEHIDLSVDVLKSGQYFAACRVKTSDQSKEWIRVQLLHVESPELLNCLLIDEGGFGMFKISDLQPLYNQFRAVPKQAIRASLAGVIPKEIDWLPKQALDFKNLIANQKFHTGLQRFDQNTFDEKQSLEIELYFAEDGELKDKNVADIVVERDIASKK